MRNFCIFLIVVFWISIAVGIDSEPKNSVGPLRKEARGNWPKYEIPTVLHGAFDEAPTGVWRVHGGHFIAYDAGEWGGAFFFQAKGEERVKMIFKRHVDSIAIVDNGTYIVAGGLAHGSEHGSVYRVWIDEHLQWQSKRILFTRTGIPAVTAITQSGAALISITRDATLIGQAERRVTVSLFEVHADGSMEYLGPPKQEKPAKD